jgi:S-adenosylmethionine hydrolase
VFENRQYLILIQSNKNFTDHISKRYSDEPVGELLTRFNSLDLLEISINGANAAELMSLSIGSVVRVDLANKKPSTDKLF